MTIATNQKDPETFWERNQHGSIVNKLHLNAFYDVLNRIYTDVLVQTAADCNAVVAEIEQCGHAVLTAHHVD